MRNKKRSAFIKYFYIIYSIVIILLVILFPIGIASSIQFENPMWKISVQILVLILLYGGMFYQRKSLIFNHRSQFLNIVSKPLKSDVKPDVKYDFKGLLYTVVFVPILIILLVFAQHLFDKYINSTSQIILNENKIIIPQRIAALSKTLSTTDSLNGYIILNELTQSEDDFDNMFYSTDGGKTKKIIDKRYVLNNLKQFKNLIYESIDWGRDPQVKLSDQDLEKIAAGFFDGSINFDHHIHFKFNPISVSDNINFEYNGKKYLIYDSQNSTTNNKLKQRGYHSWAVPMTTADYREKLFYINNQLISMLKK